MREVVARIRRRCESDDRVRLDSVADGDEQQALQLAEYLIEHGADVNRANKGKWTPLYLATDNRNIEGGDFPVPKPDLDHLEYIKFLLDHGANPNVQAKDNTPTRTIFTTPWFTEEGAT